MIKKIVLFILLMLYIPSLHALDSKGIKQELEKSGKDLNSVIKIFHQTVVFSYPMDFSFKPAFKKQRANHFIIEFLPEGQTLKNWTDMFTIQGFKNLVLQKMTSMKILTVFKQKFQKRYGTDLYFKELYRKDLTGKAGIIFLVGMPATKAKDLPKELKGKGEVALYIVLQGKQDIYLLHRSWRTDVTLGESLPIKQEYLDRWIALLKKVSLV